MGATGANGNDGAAGATGAAGTNGAKGDTGAQGPTGPAGPAGADSTVPGPPGATGPAGAQGGPGPKGDTGATGPIGTVSGVTLVTGTEVTMPAASVNTTIPAHADCPVGRTLIGGGAKVTSAGIAQGALQQSYPGTPGDGGEWNAVAVVTADGGSAADTVTVQAFAYCA
jgi:hypothetical protein